MRGIVETTHRVGEEVRKQDANLKSIKLLLDDAERKDMIDEGVKLLLDQFKEACLNMEDALDEWRTVILEVQITAVKSAYFLPRKVINGRLDEIVKEKNIYQLTCNDNSQMELVGQEYFDILASRSFLEHIEMDYAVAFTTEALRSFFKQSRRLRLLDFSCSKGPWTGDILEAVGELTYLRLYGWGVNRKPPETFSRLYSLQHLDLVGSDNLERLSDGIGNLINLRQVQGMIVRADRNDPEEFSTGDLANLNKLLLLFMTVVGNDIDKLETRKVKLEKLHELRMYVAGHVEEDDILEVINQTLVPTFMRSYDYWFYPTRERNNSFLFFF
ncbi:hypothetical protein SLEP1_g19667 [Rubroshorea leprosula]|uniref:Disease resistance N-terminal domain-containing protein n=1 Tax=Rubroshorea leprosula TaxID=152421 RepID=A0AAV5J034_9ROSI|nr:hypothetical protein SLEP1_g19667 [Rubroshorea leprosula]